MRSAAMSMIGRGTCLLRSDREGQHEIQSGGDAQVHHQPTTCQAIPIHLISLLFNRMMVLVAASAVGSQNCHLSVPVLGCLSHVGGTSLCVRVWVGVPD